jgi:PAS domain S-box-containing protein
MVANIIGASLEHKKAERALKASENKYHNLVEKGNDGIIILQDGLIKYGNQKMANITGFSIEEELEKPFIEFISPDYKELVQERHMKRLSGEEVCSNYEIEIISKDGGRIPVDISSSAIEYEGRPADMAIMRDVTGRKKAEMLLRESEEQYRSLFNAIPIGVGLADPAGNIITFNDAMLHPGGYTQKDIQKIGNVVELYYDINERNNALSIARKQGFLHNHEVQMKRKDGRPYDTLLSLVPIEIKGQQCWQAMVEDITNHKKAENAMIHAKLVAEATSQSKSEFLANISHELRTPLNLIIGFSDVINSESHGSLNESQKKYISAVLNNGKHLLNIINDILSLTKIEAGKMELHMDEFFVSDAIDEVEALMIPIASEKDIDLTCNIDIGMPGIKADMIKFKQIVYNLVSNAIKFTDQGGTVAIGGKVSDDFMHISVKDRGIGISPKDQDKLFHPFFQVDSSITRRYGGTGLGLAICQEIR